MKWRVRSCPLTVEKEHVWELAQSFGHPTVLGLITQYQTYLYSGSVALNLFWFHRHFPRAFAAVMVSMWSLESQLARSSMTDLEENARGEKGTSSHTF